MKEYVRPDVFVTEFRLNSAVAATEYKEQDITCAILSGESHGVFYSDCQSNIDGNGSKAYLKTIEFPVNSGITNTYLVWYDGHVGGRPNADGEALIKALGIQGSGWHAGIATPTIIEIIEGKS